MQKRKPADASTVRSILSGLKANARRHPKYSVGEEVANAVTHGVGALAALAAMILMIVKSSNAGSGTAVVASTVYGFGMFASMLASTLYHAIPPSRGKRVLRVIDHSAIYVFIAGTYTPFCLLTLEGWFGWGVLIFIWTVAVCGIVFKSIWLERAPIVSVILYILMGWAVVVFVVPLWGILPQDAMLLLLAGGLMYTVGTISFALTTVKHYHMIWHFFVMAGAALHFLCIYWYVL